MDSTSKAVLDLNTTVKVTEANERQEENKTNCDKVTFHLPTVTAYFLQANHLYNSRVFLAFVYVIFREFLLFFFVTHRNDKVIY